MQCIIVDEIVRVNMHQRLDLQCGRWLGYHAKRKIDNGPVRKIIFLYQMPGNNEIKGEITQSRHHVNVFCMV